MSFSHAMVIENGKKI